MAQNSTIEHMRKEIAEETKTETHTTKQMDMAKKRKQKQQQTPKRIGEKYLPDHANQQVGSRTIALVTRIRKSPEEDKKTQKRNKNKQR